MRDLADLILPRVCPVCREILSGIEREICLDCLSSFPFTYFWSLKDNPAEELFWGKIYFQRVASLFYYGDDSDYGRLIHEIKYNGRRALALFLGSMLGKRLRESGLYEDVDAVVAVPVSPVKSWMRGYNQAALIGKAVASEMGIELIKGVLKRSLFSPSQTTMDPESRWRNATISFSLANGSKIKQRHILLVDDVLTTGATLEACGAALLGVEGCRVSVATLAYVE